MKTKYFLIKNFRVSSELSANLTDWMKNDHIPKMQKSGCFKGVPLSIEVKGLNSNPDKIVYIFEALGLVNLRLYKNNYMKKMESAFQARWSKHIGVHLFVDEVTGPANRLRST